jgi:hypothetical protein
VELIVRLQARRRTRPCGAAFLGTWRCRGRGLPQANAELCGPTTYALGLTSLGKYRLSEGKGKAVQRLENSKRQNGSCHAGHRPLPDAGRGGQDGGARAPSRSSRAGPIRKNPITSAARLPTRGYLNRRLDPGSTPPNAVPRSIDIGDDDIGLGWYWLHGLCRSRKDTSHALAVRCV